MGEGLFQQGRFKPSEGFSVALTLQVVAKGRVRRSGQGCYERVQSGCRTLQSLQMGRRITIAKGMVGDNVQTGFHRSVEV